MTQANQYPQDTPSSTASAGTDRTSPTSETDVPLDCRLSAYDYDLPEGFIAQTPASPRDHSRLFVVRSPFSADPPLYEHRRFFELPTLLQPGDLLVLNNTRVIPARLYGRKLRSLGDRRESSTVAPLDSIDETSNAIVEVFLLEEQSPNRWLTLVRPGRKLRPGHTIQFGPTSSGAVVNGYIQAIDEATGGRVIDFTVETVDGNQALPNPPTVSAETSEGNEPETGRSPSSSLSLWDVLPELGEVPLPPYITNSDVEAERYQTVYSQTPGAVAAPTAGLHFTTSLLNQLEQINIKQAFVTLHVGVGTFRPVETENITSHQMHSEWVEVPDETVLQIQAAKARGNRVIAVGTTVTRALESAAQKGRLSAFRDKTSLFIYPGYQWQVIDGLITNFHLPKSSLMMMVSALMGREALMSSYQEAIAQRYRFYSLGDAMLILP